MISTLPFVKLEEVHFVLLHYSPILKVNECSSPRPHLLDPSLEIMHRLTRLLLQLCSGTPSSVQTWRREPRIKSGILGHRRI